MTVAADERKQPARVSIVAASGIDPEPGGVFEAGAMNLLSVAAAFGVITAVFERGWLASVFGVAHKGPIEAFIPVIVFAILFGLSMDYEVFLVSRMHETWHHTKDNAKAVTTGLIRTGRTITAAAAIMIFIFGSFTLGDDRIVKLFGLGLASAVLIDSTATAISFFNQRMT